MNRSDKVWPKNTFSGVQEILLDEIKNSHRSKIKLKFTQRPIFEKRDKYFNRKILGYSITLLNIGRIRASIRRCIIVAM